MSTLIRPMVAGDVQELAVVWYQVWQKCNALYMPKEIVESRTLEFLADSLHQMIVDAESLQRELFVFDTGSRIQGFLGLAMPGNVPECDCELFGMFIEPNCQREGVGSLLLMHAQSWLRDASGKRMGLWCMDQNERGIAFYKKHSGELQTHKIERHGRSLSAFTWDLRQ